MGNQHSASPALPRPRKNVHWKSAGRPGAPGRPQLAPPPPHEEPGAVLLRWAPPAHDGGSQLQGYQVEVNRLGSSEWVRPAPALVSRPELLLSGLEAPHRYQVRVAAVAPGGRSDYSEPSDVLTVHPGSPVSSPPVFTRRLADCTALVHEPAEFRVEFSGQPPPAIHWFKDGCEIFSSRRTAINTNENSSVLVFQHTLPGDAGELRCTATNRAGHAATRAALHLLAAPRLRLPRRYEDGLLVEAGEPVCLQAALVGEPPPAVEWLHDGRPLAGDPRVLFTTTGDNSVLRIAAARREDRGEYRVLARNDVGEDSAAFLVTVTAPPQPPGRVRVLRQLGRGVLLAWEPPEDDGGCGIGAYVVEYWRAGWDVWLKATTSRGTSVELHDLIEGSEYRFRVKAESPYGLSAPSEESTPLRVPGRPPDATTLAAEAAIRAGREAAEPAPAPRRARAAAPQPPVADDNEFMLVLYPDPHPPSAADTAHVTNAVEVAEQQTEYGESWESESYEWLSPPTLSLSAPDLSPRVVCDGGDAGGMLRRAASCSRLLLERAMARAHAALAMRDRAGITSRPRPSLSPLAASPSPTRGASFDEDYTASTASTPGDERSDSGASRASSTDFTEPASATYALPLPTPAPGFVPKPILKKRESEPPNAPSPPFPNNNLSKSPTPIMERLTSKKEEKKKGTLFKKITKMPIQKSNLMFSKIGLNKSSDRKHQSECIPEAEVKPTPPSPPSEVRSEDPGRTVIEYYGNIVKEFGGQKRPPPQLYLNTADLKTVAEKQELENKTNVTVKNTKRGAVTTKNEVRTKSTNAKRKETSENAAYKTINMKQRKTSKLGEKKADFNSKAVPVENNNILNTKGSQLERATIVIPIDYGALQRRARVRVRRIVACCVDVSLLLLSGWLLLCRDARLALPPLALLACRALPALALPRLPALPPPFARYFADKTS